MTFNCTCDMNANCTNTAGSYECACVAGFQKENGYCIGKIISNLLLCVYITRIHIYLFFVLLLKNDCCFQILMNAVTMVVAVVDPRPAPTLWDLLSA